MTTIDLGYRPRPWQAECHRQRRRFTVLALHRRAGKTELALAELIDKALRFHRELGLFFYVAPLLKQAKAIALSEARAAGAKIPAPKKRGVPVASREPMLKAKGGLCNTLKR